MTTERYACRKETQLQRLKLRRHKTKLFSTQCKAALAGGLMLLWSVAYTPAQGSMQISLSVAQLEMEKPQTGTVDSKSPNTNSDHRVLEAPYAVPPNGTATGSNDALLVPEKPHAAGSDASSPSSNAGSLAPEKPLSDNGLRMELPTFSPGSPLALPNENDAGAAPSTFKLGTSKGRNLSADDKGIFDRMKKEPNKEVQAEALKVFDAGNYKLAQELYELLTRRDPKNPDYFYGAGDAYAYEQDNPSAFSNFLTAWHLANNSSDPRFANAANNMVEKMRAQVDDQFRLTYHYHAGDDETMLNAATRMWKSGFTKQSVQLNEWALKNEPLYAHVAAYNLGAIAEHNGDYKQALQYYSWAAKRARLLEAHASDSAQIGRAMNELPPLYIEKAADDMRNALQGNATAWNGWSQAEGTPQHWSSEVCPLCAISRTQLDYLPGQMTLEH